MSVSFSAATLAAALPAHVLLILASSIGVLALLIYAGVALPAVWSAKPARRKAAAEVLIRSSPSSAGDDRRFARHVASPLPTVYCLGEPFSYGMVITLTMSLSCVFPGNMLVRLDEYLQIGKRHLSLGVAAAQSRAPDGWLSTRSMSCPRRLMFAW